MIHSFTLLYYYPLGLFARINLVHNPELYRLLEAGESIEDLLKLPIEDILLRWFNYHLKQAGSARRVKNFSGDIKDWLNEMASKGYIRDSDFVNVGNAGTEVFYGSSKMEAVISLEIKV